MGLRKALLARLYLKVKVYITSLLGVYNVQILFRFLYFWGIFWPTENLSLVNMEWTFFYILNFFHDELFKVHFLLYFHHNQWWERGGNQLKVFLKDFTSIWGENFGNSQLTLNTLNTQKSNSIQTLIEDIPEIKLYYWSLLCKTF